MCCNLKKKKRKTQHVLHPSLRDSTCPNPKSSDPSRSIPHLLLPCSALGVLATPHLLSQTQRGGSKTTPLEDGSYRLRWLSRRSKCSASLCPHNISLCFAAVISEDSFAVILSKKVIQGGIKTVFRFT